MSKQDIDVQSEESENFRIRSFYNRFGTFGAAVGALQLDLIAKLGKTEAAAKAIAKAFSQEITISHPGCKFDYVIGDTALLITTVNASTIPEMDAARKLLVVNILSQQT